jgi:uncharacterized protein YybS (DUF2232 family)
VSTLCFVVVIMKEKLAFCQCFFFFLLNVLCCLLLTPLHSSSVFNLIDPFSLHESCNCNLLVDSPFVHEYVSKSTLYLINITKSW